MHFSIITPVFNNRSELPRCIGSVKGQCAPGHTIEHIVRDGGSSDGTVEWLKDTALRIFPTRIMV